jgi:glycosyltransferase involved in cell wall biosynthesis
MLNINGKKILLLVSYTIPYTSGSGINAFNFGKFLLEKGVNVKILTFSRNLSLPLKSSYNKLLIYRIPYLNKGIALKLISLFLILPFYIYFIIKTNILIIYGGNIIAWEFAILFGKILHKKVIFRSTMFNEDDPVSLTKNKTLKTLRKPLLKIVDIYYSLHPGFTKSYKSLFPDSNNVLETVQGVNNEVFKPLKSEEEKRRLRNKLKLPLNKYIILSVGLLVERKGYLKIFNELSKLDIPFLYVILGEYSLNKKHHLYNRHEEISEIFENGKEILKDKVDFRGFQENIVDYYKSADIFLMNSYMEGIPNSLLEAMSCGLPIVCNNMTGLENYLIFNSYNCLIFHNFSEIPNMINRIYSQYRLSTKLAKNSQVIIKKHFSFEKVYKNLKKCLIF